MLSHTYHSTSLHKHRRSPLHTLPIIIIITRINLSQPIYTTT